MNIPRRPVEPADITRIRWVSDARISPDGARVAFVVTTLDEGRDEYLSNIWIVDVADGPPARPNAETDTGFPGGRRTSGGLGAVDAPSTSIEPRRFTAGPKRDKDPRWSPDGQWLAFV